MTYLLCISGRPRIRIACLSRDNVCRRSKPSFASCFIHKIWKKRLVSSEKTICTRLNKKQSSEVNYNQYKPTSPENTKWWRIKETEYVFYLEYKENDMFIFQVSFAVYFLSYWSRHAPEIVGRIDIRPPGHTLLPDVLKGCKTFERE